MVSFRKTARGLISKIARHTDTTSILNNENLSQFSESIKNVITSLTNLQTVTDKITYGVGAAVATAADANEVGADGAGADIKAEAEANGVDVGVNGADIKADANEVGAGANSNRADAGTNEVGADANAPAPAPDAEVDKPVSQLEVIQSLIGVVSSFPSLSKGYYELFAILLDYILDPSKQDEFIKAIKAYGLIFSSAKNSLDILITIIDRADTVEEKTILFKTMKMFISSNSTDLQTVKDPSNVISSSNTSFKNSNISKLRKRQQIAVVDAASELAKVDAVGGAAAAVDALEKLFTDKSVDRITDTLREFEYINENDMFTIDGVFNDLSISAIALSASMETIAKGFGAIDESSTEKFAEALVLNTSERNIISASAKYKPVAASGIFAGVGEDGLPIISTINISEGDFEVSTSVTTVGNYEFTTTSDDTDNFYKSDSGDRLYVYQISANSEEKKQGVHVVATNNGGDIIGSARFTQNGEQLRDGSTIGIFDASGAMSYYGESAVVIGDDERTSVEFIGVTYFWKDDYDSYVADNGDFVDFYDTNGDNTTFQAVFNGNELLDARVKSNNVQLPDGSFIINFIGSSQVVEPVKTITDENGVQLLTTSVLGYNNIVQPISLQFDESYAKKLYTNGKNSIAFTKGQKDGEFITTNGSQGGGSIIVKVDFDF
jgi:hypothetical protein